MANTTVVNLRRNSRDQYVAGVNNTLSWDEALDLVIPWAEENGLQVTVTSLDLPPEVGTVEATGRVVRWQNYFYVYDGRELLLEAPRKEIVGVLVKGAPGLTV